MSLRYVGQRPDLLRNMRVQSLNVIPDCTRFNEAAKILVWGCHIPYTLQQGDGRVRQAKEQAFA